MAERKDFLKGKKAVTFLDLFAGAGGISEGFLQAYTKNKYYKFILASDINENCELTHRVRYNHQLGLDTKFLTGDIMAPDFTSRLLDQLNGQEIDVVTGGPSCQSFSLSGRRKRFDKRDNLFLHYLNVIRKLRLLTKDKGHFKDAIMREIRSIIDDTNIPQFLMYVERLLSKNASQFIKNCILTKVKMEIGSDENAELARTDYFSFLESQFRSITRKIEYRLSKSNIQIVTIRHGLNLLRQTEERNAISSSVINLKTLTDIDNDYYVNGFNSFLSLIDDSTIINSILSAIDTFGDFGTNSSEVSEFREMIKLYSFTLDETLDIIKEYAKDDNSIDELNLLLEDLILYRVDKPIVVHSANYGVPQNRERVIFIGCRKTNLSSVKFLQL
jgi:DNA (cytosine-5)-methyltransferase 1